MSETDHLGPEPQDAILGLPAKEKTPDSPRRVAIVTGAAKAGMQGLTKTLAIELGPFGITANAVAPGFIATDMTAATAARLGVTFEDFQATVASQVPGRRIGEADDVAQAISFLASERASYISGQVIYVGRPTVLTGTGAFSPSRDPKWGSAGSAPASSDRWGCALRYRAARSCTGRTARSRSR